MGDEEIITRSETTLKLEDKLTYELRGNYEAARKRGYVATYFLPMLEEHGGVETAKRLLAKYEPQTGLFELWGLGLLHESIEAVFCKRSLRYYLRMMSSSKRIAD